MSTTTHLHGLVQYPKLHNREWLKERYITLKKSQKSIARELGCSPANVAAAIRKFGLQRQAFVFEAPRQPQYAHTDYRCPYCQGTGRLERR